MRNSTKRFSFSKSLIASVTLLAGILLNITGYAQNSNTNSGTNFWFAFPSNYDANSTDYVVYINTFYTTNGTISIPGMAWSQSFTAVAGTTTRIVVPSADANITTFTGPVGQAVNVVSDSNVSVFAAIEHGLRTENTIIMPVPQLGNQYYIMDYTLLPSNYSENTEFLVVAQGCTDSVEIIPSQNITVSGTHAANVPYTVVLSPGQVYEVICNTGDLTGSMVRSLNHSETGVFAASTFNAVSCNNTGNPFYEEMMPVNNWGNNYVFLPTTQAQDQCRVLSEQNGTIVTFMTTLGNNVQTLNAGQYYDTTVIYSTPVYISSNNPVSVERLLRTATCNNYYVTNPGTLGDPSEAMVAPNSQMLSDSTVFYVSLTPDFDSPMFKL